jgi:hypothetical protein
MVFLFIYCCSSTHEKPIKCYNAHTNRKCRVMLLVPALPADNPQQSEESSHIGGNANCKCRKCKIGGNHEHTESDEGYHSLHFVCIPYFKYLFQRLVADRNYESSQVYSEQQVKPVNVWKSSSISHAMVKRSPFLTNRQRQEQRTRLHNIGSTFSYRNVVKSGTTNLNGVPSQLQMSYGRG